MWNNTLCQIIEKGRWIIPTQLQLSLIWSTSYKLISASTNKHEQWEETKFGLSCWKSPTVISGGNKQTNQKTANVNGQLKPVQGQCRGKSLKIKRCHKSMYINPWETTSTVRMQLLHSLAGGCSWCKPIGWSYPEVKICNHSTAKDPWGAPLHASITPYTVTLDSQAPQGHSPR